MQNTITRPPMIGSLCSGYGGLDLGVQSALGGTLAWHAEVNPDAARILARHWPGVPNLGDITAVDWSTVPQVCVLTAGFPCQRRLGRRPPGRTQRPHPLGAVAARRPCGRSPPPLPGGDRKCPRPPQVAPPASLATWNSARGVWETTQPSLLCGHLAPYSDPWPTSGTTHGGSCFALPTSEHRS